jgi:4-amino-4-deoxy-L-arabinose transferase-like glycosyltransferase
VKKILSTIGRTIVQAESKKWLIVTCALWLLATAGWRPLALPDEGRYIGVAMEMLNSGDWLVPTLNGLPFFHKPPLFYWITASALEIFGANAWAGRMASLLAGIAVIIATHAFVRRHWNAGTANVAIVILATQPFFFGAVQYANLDMLVASMITLTVGCLADAAIQIDSQQSGTRSLAAGYVFTALGVLAKGLIGFLLPWTVIFLWLVLRGKLMSFFRLLKLPFIGLFLLVAAPWFWAMAAKFPEFLDYFFIEQHFRRFAGSGFNNAQAFWFYVPVLLLLTLPWSLWSFRLGHWRKNQQGDDTNGIRPLMLIWLLVIVVFFSIPKSKIVGYILPVLAPFAFLLADAATCWLDKVAKEKAEAWLGATLVTSVLICVVLIGYLRLQDTSHLSHFAANNKQAFQRGDQVVMLDQYPYDLPFYLRSTKPAWVVSDWENLSTGKADNWRKELVDAGRFAPQARQDYLISPKELVKRLCDHHDTTYWIWGQRDTSVDLHWLAAAKQVFSNDRNGLWRLQPSDSDLNAMCD